MSDDLESLWEPYGSYGDLGFRTRKIGAVDKCSSHERKVRCSDSDCLEGRTPESADNQTET